MKWLRGLPMGDNREKVGGGVGVEVEAGQQHWEAGMGDDELCDRSEREGQGRCGWDGSRGRAGREH